MDADDHVDLLIAVSRAVHDTGERYTLDEALAMFALNGEQLADG